MSLPRRRGQGALLGAALLAAGCAGSAKLSTEPEPVAPEPVELESIELESIEPWADAGELGTVFVFVGSDCPISNAYTPELGRIRAEYEPRGFAFYRVYVGRDAAAADVAAHGRDFALDIPAVRDADGALARALGASVTPEAALLDAERRLLYRGRIDDLYADFGQRRRAPRQRELRDALDALADGRPVAVARAPAVGCALPRPAPSAPASGPTFAGDVAPIVYASCAPCHHPGGGAPFPLLTYDELHERRVEIRDVITSGFMPPWKPEPGYGAFAGERRLSDEELALLVAWLDAGAPPGDLDAAPPPPEYDHDWALGEPDLVVAMPEPFVVPAEGIDAFRSFALPVELPADRWVEAVEILPSNRPVLHHVVMYVDETGTARALDEADPGVGYAGMFAAGLADQPELAGWAPGLRPRRFPDGVSWRLPRRSEVVLDSHFQTTGRPEQITLRVGLWFADGPPRKPLGLVRLGVPSLNIPPGESDHVVRNDVVLPVDVEAVGIVPHGHYVCAETRCDAVLPSGERVPLIWIREWDFNWQDLYQFAEPVPLPAGTRIEMRFRYDNSAANPRNPHHPPRRVFDGARTEDEMAVLRVQVTCASGADAQVLHEHAARRTLDRSGQLEGACWRFLVATFDADDDGSLDADEDAAATRYVEELAHDEELLTTVFDLDNDGMLTDDERAEARRLLALWHGERSTR